MAVNNSRRLCVLTKACEVDEHFVTGTGQFHEELSLYPILFQARPYCAAILLNVVHRCIIPPEIESDVLLVL